MVENENAKVSQISNFLNFQFVFSSVFMNMVNSGSTASAFMKSVEMLGKRQIDRWNEEL